MITQKQQEEIWRQARIACEKAKAEKRSRGYQQTETYLESKKRLEELSDLGANKDV